MKYAKIRDGGFFKKGLVIVTNIKKNGEEGESKAYTVAGRVDIEPADGKYILHFTSVAGSSIGGNTRGTISGRSYRRSQNIIVDGFKVME